MNTADAMDERLSALRADAGVLRPGPRHMVDLVTAERLLVALQAEAGRPVVPTRPPSLRPPRVLPPRFEVLETEDIDVLEDLPPDPSEPPMRLGSRPPAWVESREASARPEPPPPPAELDEVPIALVAPRGAQNTESLSPGPLPPTQRKRARFDPMADAVSSAALQAEARRHDSPPPLPRSSEVDIVLDDDDLIELDILEDEAPRRLQTVAELLDED